MNKQTNRIFLFSGLILLLIAILIRYCAVGVHYSLFWIVFGAAILLKATFLVNTFRTGRVKSSLWLYFILVGVIMIFISLIFRYIYPVPLLRNILFYGAITLKITGLILMFFQKKI